MSNLRNERGYGGFGLDGKSMRAHRVSWMINYGEIPEGMCVCHRCDNPLCVNPNHLFLGTHTENMRDKSKKGRCNPCIGEKASWRKLNESDVVEIRRLYATGNYKQRDLAKQFGVSQSSILWIVNGRNWKHIGGGQIENSVCQ